MPLTFFFSLLSKKSKVNLSINDGFTGFTVRQVSILHIHDFSLLYDNNNNNNTQQNSKCRLCGDRDETIYHIISEWSKLAQREYKARHNWVGKVIHWEMCKKLKFDHTNKWYMHNPAPVLENATHKLLWDFNIQTDHLIPGRRPDLIIIHTQKNENLQNSRLCCPGWPQNKTERMWKEG